MTNLEFICQACNHSFESPKRQARFCSKVCRAEGCRKPSASKACTQCGEMITGRPAKVKARKYCSKKCSELAMRRHLYTCGMCGKEFYRPYRALYEKVYCSRGCHAKSQLGQIPHNKKEHVTLQCAECGKDFAVVPARLATAKFCSHQCMSLAKTHCTGPEHPLYKPPAQLICQRCGNHFEARAVFADPAKGKKYCSRECLGAAVTARQGGRQSGLERRLAELITRRGYDFIPQMKVGRYSVDFGFPGSWHVLELHGDYWHNLEKQKKRDEKKMAYLLSKGYAVVVVWEHQFNTNPEMWTDKIMDYVCSEVL